MNTQALVVLITVPTAEAGEQIARALLNAGLAACVNFVPSIRSLYIWQGKICDDTEILLLVKSKKELFPSLEQAVKSIHPYQTPEIITIPITDGSQAYLEWINEVTSTGLPHTGISSEVDNI